jgi:molybdenum cofactor biosynthesis enzyme MoaA
MLGVLRKMLPGALQKWLLKGWLRLERHLPMPVRSFFWNDFSLFGKPQLGYLEANLVDHCNLNCRRCSHFAPLAEPHFVAPDDFERDMRRLSALFRNIRVIRLMGGEPLLHPEAERFLSIARTAFPLARIHLVTNGLLLDELREAF